MRNMREKIVTDAHKKLKILEKCSLKFLNLKYAPVWQPAPPPQKKYFFFLWTARL